MAHRTKTAAHLTLALGLLGVACSQSRTDPAPSEAAPAPSTTSEDSTWIEGEVERRPGTRVIALDKSGTNDNRPFFSAASGPDRRYRIGPLPPGEYEVSVVPFDQPEHVDNFTITSVTATASHPARADFSQPGNRSLVVRFPTPPTPGTLVTEIQLFAGSQKDVSMARYRELRQAEPDINRGRNTISADDLTTTFGGLVPGAYTACAVTNYGGEDLRPTCQDANVQSTEPTELTLDVRLG